jgi:myosin heavy subunit
MAENDENAPKKRSFEELVKDNVTIWLLGSLLTGFLSGVAAVKWNDERYNLEPISSEQKHTYEKAAADLAALQKTHQELAASSQTLQSTNESLKADVARLTTENNRQTARLGELQANSSSAAQSCARREKELSDMKAEDAQLKDEIRISRNVRANSQASELKLQSELGACQTKLREGAMAPDLLKVSLRVFYRHTRTADANRIFQKLSSKFKDIDLNVCDCSNSATIEYSYPTTAQVAFSVAKVLTQAGVPGFTPASPMSEGGSSGAITLYLQ